MPKPGGMIYALGTVGTSWVKIGCTTGLVEERVKILQTGQPFPLQILAQVSVDANVRRIEKHVHAFLAAERQQGEWFDIPIDMATLETLIVRAITTLESLEEPEDRDAAPRVPSMLGTRVRQARLQYGMSQAELARRIGVSKTAMNDLEQGKTVDPRLSHIVAIADQLRLSVDALIGRTDALLLGGKDAEAPAPPAPRRRPRNAAPVG
jgi:DNA-binding XRE family transcriptional regulator